jgi:hypothetical protein
MSVIFWKIGMMDCWNSGIMGIKIGNERFFVFLLTPSFPAFHYSSLPVGRVQLGKALSSHIIDRLQRYSIQKSGNSREYQRGEAQPGGEENGFPFPLLA